MKIPLLVAAALVALIFLCPSGARADYWNEYVEGGVGVFMIGYAMIDVDELNDALEASPNNLAAFDAWVVTYGGSGYGVIGNRILLGLEGHAFSQEVVSTSFVQRLSGGYGMFDVGYAVVQDGGFRAYPMVGFGWGGMTLRITERATLSFDDVMTDPSRESVLEIGGFMLQASVGADWLIPLGEDEDGAGGLVLGFRAGYVQSFYNAKWKLAENDLAGAPDAGISGFFVRFSVGGGGYARDTDAPSG